MIEYKDKKININDVFKDSKYRIFREFCEQEKIIYISSIDDQTINKFSQVKGVGEVRLSQVVDKLEKMNMFLNIKKEKLSFDIDKIKIKEEQTLKSLEIDIIFSNPKFSILRKYCLDRKISTLWDMTNKDIDEFKRERGIGKKRYKEFIETLMKAINSNPIKSIDEISEIALKELDDQESLIVIGRLIEDLSLEETADILEVNYEKAEQLERETFRKVQSTLNKYNVMESLKYIFKSSDTRLSVI